MQQWALTASSNTKHSCFACSPDWQWLQLDIFFFAGTGCIRCGAYSPQWVWLLQVRDHACSRECVCLRTLCASSIRCNSVDNVWFLSGKLKRHLCPEDTGLIVYTPGSISCLHFTKLSFHIELLQGGCCGIIISIYIHYYIQTVQLFPWPAAAVKNLIDCSCKRAKSIIGAVGEAPFVS